MKVLMFGWEFPPQSSGGLGTACYGLTKGIINRGVEVLFVLPKAKNMPRTHVQIIDAENISTGKNLNVNKINSLLKPYSSFESYNESYDYFLGFGKNKNRHSLYGKDLYQEVYRYSKRAAKIARKNDFDIIHAHDWMTFPAGIAARRVSKKPLIVHVHATEFDRTGGNVNQTVYDIEREGMHKADKIIAVSNFTKNKIVEHYGIAPDKVEVVHNAVERRKPILRQKKNKSEKMVLFLGRITLQKGPDYFLDAAKKVLEKKSNVKFVIAGSGDMQPFLISRAIELGIADKVLFSGFLSGEDIDRMYSMADLYVMPSVSEPFGITPLEAIRNNTPVLISKQSGVSEVLTNALKVDFWDINQMANKIIAVLEHNELKHELQKNSSMELKKFDWNIAGEKCVNIYKKAASSWKGM